MEDEETDLEVQYDDCLVYVQNNFFSCNDKAFSSN